MISSTLLLRGPKLSAAIQRSASQRDRRSRDICTVLETHAVPLSEFAVCGAQLGPKPYPSFCERLDPVAPTGSPSSTVVPERNVCHHEASGSHQVRCPLCGNLLRLPSMSTYPPLGDP